ncbi:hypothetical protein [Streptomyces sp. NPDC087859]|uniref:hypothetical protein n=1 Tax=Streptomyces sp. NPDC087859 TaxID=3365812 RepID=UPI00380716E9
MRGTADLSFPLDAYQATTEQQTTLAQAQGVLTSRCMARLGFTYRAPEQPATSASGSNARVFGLVDQDMAARYGYLNPETANAPVRAVTESLSEAEQLALNGEDDLDPADAPANLEEAEKTGGSDVTFNGERVPVGGCVRESYLKLYARKANEVDILFVFNLKSEAQSRARADSRVRAVDKRWSSCMSKAGYKLTEPANAVKELGLTESNLSSSRAVAAAKADVACKQQVDFVQVRYAVTTTYQHRLIEENTQALSMAKEQLESRLLLAAELT